MTKKKYIVGKSYRYSEIPEDDPDNENLTVSDYGLEYIGQSESKKYQEFFDFLNQEHDLVCTIEQMDEIINESLKFVKKYNKE